MFFLKRFFFAFSNIFKTKWTKSEEKLNFGGRWVWVPMTPIPQSKIRGDPPATMDFYADLCFPRPGESFSVYKLCLRMKGNILRIILTEKRGGHDPRGPSRSYAYGSSRMGHD